MNIDDLRAIQNVGTPAKNSSKPVSGAEFRDLLEAQLQSMAGPTPATSAKHTEATTVSPTLRIESLSVAEETINNLESFGRALGNMDFRGQSLEPFVETLEEETSSILALKDQLPADDPLARLLEQVATVSYVETAKFRRGDYQ